MSKRVTRGWLTRAGIAVAMGAAAIIAAVTIGGFTATHAAPGDDIEVTVSGGGIVPLGGNFSLEVNSVVTNGTGTFTTFGGWTTQLAFNPAMVAENPSIPNGASSGGLCIPASNWAEQLGNPAGIMIMACAFQSQSLGGHSEHINLTCIGAGTTALHLVTGGALGEDPANGTAYFDENGVGIKTGTTDASVTCALPITKTDNLGGNDAVAGGSVQYTVHVGNPDSVSSPGHVITDTVPAPLTNVAVVSRTNGAFDGCGVVGNTVTCSTATINPDADGGFDLVISADVPLSAAGATGVCNTATEAATSAPDCFDVAAAGVSVTKTADAASYSAGDVISWTITVNSTGGSPAAGVTVADTATDGWDIVSTTNSANCTAGAPTAGAVSWSCGDLASTDGPQVLTVTGTVHTPNPTDVSCDNDVAVSSTNGASDSTSASVTCKSKNARMVKDTDGNTDETGNELANLFLCKNSTNCNTSGNGALDINEWALNVGGDPQGVGAFEFQVKYDNHIFDINIDPTGYLYSTGRVPDDGSVLGGEVGGCNATIITENDIRFGCVSKNPQPLDAANGTCLGPDNVTPVDGAVCGPQNDGIVAVIHVTPKADLVNRITPGNDNGAIRSLLDEGCELADIWGHPLSAAPAPAGVDALGREIPLPGIEPGGQVSDCADITITVRILEGDMNLDCIVDVGDDQTEAAHYGATFGALLYQPWYDLEPALKDNDVDIKDLQKVFGRNGSTCATPVPPQPALQEPVDP